MGVPGPKLARNQGEDMRQASWIAFLLMTLGLLSYTAAVDQQEPTEQPEVVGLEGTYPPPKP